MTCETHTSLSLAKMASLFMRLSVQSSRGVTGSTSWLMLLSMRAGVDVLARSRDGVVIPRCMAHVGGM